MIGFNRKKLSTAIKESKKVKREAESADRKLNGLRRGHHGNTSRSRKTTKIRLETYIEGVTPDRRRTGNSGAGGQAIGDAEKFSS